MGWNANAATVILGLLMASPCAGAPETHVVETKHYRLAWQGDLAEAEEMSRVLEAAWEEFKAFFEAVPTLKENEKLAVGFFQNREGWAESIRKPEIATP